METLKHNINQPILLFKVLSVLVGVLGLNLDLQFGFKLLILGFSFALFFLTFLAEAILKEQKEALKTENFWGKIKGNKKMERKPQRTIQRIHEELAE